MAKPRDLSKAPVLEAVINFGFSGVQLNREALVLLAAPYEEQGWQRQEAHTFEATIGPAVPDAPLSIVSSGGFAGFVLRDPGGGRFIRLETSQISASVTNGYSGWEALREEARQAFEAFVKASHPSAVGRIATRFINRIPPHADFTQFDQILTRPPLQMEELPGAYVSDFLRRHVITNLEGGFTANLTIGTATSEADEPASPAKAIVIDVDVFKECDLPPMFDLMEAELAEARTIKNQLFFGSLQDAVVERFE